MRKNKYLQAKVLETIIALPLLIVLIMDGYYHDGSYSKIGLLAVSAGVSSVGFMFLWSFVVGKLYLHENPRINGVGDENILVGRRARLTSFFPALIFLFISFYVYNNIYSVILGFFIGTAIFFIRLKYFVKE